MREKLNCWLDRDTGSVHMLRTLVGGYIAYLGGQILASQGAGTMLRLAAVLLLLAGLSLALISLYGVLRCRKSSNKDRPEER